MDITIEHLSDKGADALEKAGSMETWNECYHKALRYWEIRILLLEKYEVVNSTQHELIADQKLKQEFFEIISYFNKLKIK